MSARKAPFFKNINSRTNIRAVQKQNAAGLGGVLKLKSALFLF
jgi:hypothetical protein